MYGDHIVWSSEEQNLKGPHYNQKGDSKRRAGNAGGGLRAYLSLSRDKSIAVRGFANANIKPIAGYQPGTTRLQYLYDILDFSYADYT